MPRAWLVPASTLLPFFGLRLTLELLQAEAPETLQEFLQLFQPRGARAVDPPPPPTPLGHGTGPLENAQVLRDSGPAYVEARRDLTRGQLVLADQLENLPPPRLGQRLDGRLHGSIVSIHLRKCQLP